MSKQLDPEMFGVVEKLLMPERPHLPRGRPSIFSENLTSWLELQTMYKQLGSIQATAAYYCMSPTTIKKYLKGSTRPTGRPIQPKSWEIRSKTPIHKWFYENRLNKLPKNTKALSRISGFSVRAIDRYLYRRRSAVLDFVASRKPLNELSVLLTDINKHTIPTTLISTYNTTADKFDLSLTFHCVLKTGHFKTIEMSFREYLNL